jgi:hypothetical protein
VIAQIRAGVLLVSSEYRFGTIRPTILFNPARSHVLAAKAVAGALAGIAFGVLGEAIGWAVGYADANPRFGRTHGPPSPSPGLAKRRRDHVDRLGRRRVYGGPTAVIQAFGCFTVAVAPDRRNERTHHRQLHLGRVARSDRDRRRAEPAGLCEGHEPPRALVPELQAYRAQAIP